MGSWMVSKEGKGENSPQGTRQLIISLLTIPFPKLPTVDYEAHSRFASKIFPLPFLNPTPDPVVALQSTSTSTPSRPASTDPSGIGSSALSSASGKPDSVYASRAIPMRVYLPDGAPVVQEVVPPLNLDGGWSRLVPGVSIVTRTDRSSSG